MRQQISRLLIVFGLVFAALIAARRLLVPPTFGTLGHYRAAAIEEIAARKIKYAGHDACTPCHDQIAKVHAEHHHRGVSCEVCHGPAAAHVESPAEVKPAIPRQRGGACALCHGYNPSRPTGFPQIDPASHNTPKPCISCHKPHEPEPPHTPEECSACHGEIARTKAVSHHALLPCTRCHENGKQHRVEPRLSRPSKPTAREFCGGCHAPDAKSDKDIPRVNMAEHGDRYVCWQCHYPHYPELK